jgi:hypothetical protein
MQNILLAPDITDLVEDLDLFTDHTRQREQQPMQFAEDPLALSCSSYRAYVENSQYRWKDFSDCTVEPADREQADAIRHYYGSKLVMEALMGRKLTEFRAKMGQFLAGNHELRRDELGMLYKIPYFYHEDLAVDRVIGESVSAEEVHEVKHRLRLTHHSTILQARKSGEMKQYWFIDDKRQAYMVSGAASTPLTTLVESVFARGTIDIIANIVRKPHYGIKRTNYYYAMSQLQLV